MTRSNTTSRVQSLAIGAVSKDTGVHIETIRYYERIRERASPANASAWPAIPRTCSCRGDAPKPARSMVTKRKRSASGVSNSGRNATPLSANACNRMSDFPVRGPIIRTNRPLISATSTAPVHPTAVAHARSLRSSLGRAPSQAPAAAPMTRRASTVPSASPFSKSPSMRAIWFVTFAKHRTGFCRASAKA